MLEGTLKIIWFQPHFHGTSFPMLLKHHIQPGFEFPGTTHSHLLWTTCSSALAPSQERKKMTCFITFFLLISPVHVWFTCGCNCACLSVTSSIKWHKEPTMIFYSKGDKKALSLVHSNQGARQGVRSVLKSTSAKWQNDLVPWSPQNCGGDGRVCVNQEHQCRLKEH